MSSVRSIAEQAGVSAATVSRALNNDTTVSAKTRELVLAIANRTGYVATTGRRITTNVGFTYTGTQTLSHPYDAAVLGGLARGLNTQRFDVLILDMQRDKTADETYTQFFMRKGVRGVILRTRDDSRDICRAVAEEGFPHVVISERFDSSEVNCIDCDSKPGSMRAVEYLVDLGHRRIAFAMHNVADRDHMDRFTGYKEALANRRIPFDESRVFKHPSTLAGGATVMKLALSMPNRPTAIYFADPRLAVGAVKKAQELNVRIPEDMSVVGFDDADMRHSVHPTLTAVCQDAEALGFEASAWLTRMLVDPSNGKCPRTLSAFFEVNQSTGPPPASPVRVPRTATNASDLVDFTDTQSYHTHSVEGRGSDEPS